MSEIINVTQSSMPPYEEYMEEVKDLWSSRWLSNAGIKHETLRQQLADFGNVPYVNLFTNGHLALEYMMEALHLKGEVITTAFTFASTTHALVRKGLQPVFCDIDYDTYTIDVNQIEELITPNTSAILPVHVYGNACDVNAIERIANKHNLKVIYDGAHAFGVSVNGKSIASYGDATMFSFHATKVFHTIEGGAVTHHNEQLFDELNALRNFGMTKDKSVDYIGGNAKMNEFQAAMGICNLRHFHDEVEKRKRVAQCYDEKLRHVDVLRCLRSQQGVTRNYAYYPVLFQTSSMRDAVYDYLNENNVKSRKYFYPLTKDLPCYEGRFLAETPVAQDVASRILTLPLYADLALDDVDRICQLIQSRLEQMRKGEGGSHDEETITFRRVFSTNTGH